MENICVPLQLDAFCLSPPCCDGPVKICPITQPNYTFLRIDNNLISHDVMDQIDLHETSPANLNPRITDMGTPDQRLRMNRLGVYLHWSLPRVYRTGKNDANSKKAQTGKDGVAVDDGQHPVFPEVPNRWLVVRQLVSPPADSKIPVFESWVVESDLISKVDDIPADVDLETDVSPFVQSLKSAADQNSIDAQGEVFIGKKWPESNPPWKETPDPNKDNHVDLSIVQSSNPLFADFTMHNTNVFSIIDDFRDKDGNHLTTATANYYVVGWHSDEKDDPLMSSDGNQDLSDRLPGLLMTLGDITKGRNVKGNSRLVCHGAIYDVHYDFNKRPDTVAADKVAANFTNAANMEPISVGTTALDALLAFLDAHQGGAPDLGISSTLTTEIRQIAGLLLADEGDYDSQVKAQDLLYGQNYAQGDGGFEWHFDGNAGPDGAPAKPPDTDILRLAKLNEQQSRLDATSRALTEARWLIFAEWFKFVLDRENHLDAGKITQWTARVAAVQKDVTNLIAAQQAIQDNITQIIDGTDSSAPAPALACKKTAKPPFFIRKDPTVCVAGMESPWPKDYVTTNLTVRLESEIPDPKSNSLDPKTNVIADTKLAQTAKKLLAECLLPRDATAPKPWQKSWNATQPWFPLFVEWEAMYFHIPFEKWTVEERAAKDPLQHALVRYGIDERLDDPKNSNILKDSRTISGRVMILPQPTFSLAAIVNQVLDSTPDEVMRPLFTPEQQKNLHDNIEILKTDLRNNIDSLKFLSFPLSGFTEHLITRAEGAHVKPNYRVPGKTVVPLGAAVNPTGPPIGLDAPTVQLIDDQSAVTPYGNLMNFPPDITPFKGVTHGQAMFTKFNIIDKFGQAVTAIEPKPRPKAPHIPPSIFPCLSDYFTPNMLDPKVPDVENIVFHDTDPKACRFIQMTPSINQDARINACFVSPQLDSKGAVVGWQPTSEWEEPIWGWLVVNYANYGLQIFLPDGTFYREVRLGGPFGAATSAKWLPFDRPSVPDIPKPQLDALITRLQEEDGHYLRAFFAMINGAIGQMPHAPSEYSNYLSSLVGKPLALVNTAWWLELSKPPITNQAVIGPSPVPDPNQGTPEAKAMGDYKFPIKLGDRDRPFDGLVAYFDSDLESTDPKFTAATNFLKVHTYFMDTDDTTSTPPVPIPDDPRHEIGTTTPDTPPYPVLTPYFLDPDTTKTPHYTLFPPDQLHTNLLPNQLLVKPALVDPFTPIHAYSPILPIQSLSLPPWTVQSACKKITAFFHLGPCLVTTDPLPGDPSTLNLLKPGDQLPGPTDDPANPATITTSVPPVKLPITSAALWRWLQPYAATKVGADGKPEADGKLETQFASLGVAGTDGAPKWAPGPYTMTEGYLQLLQNVIPPKV